MRGLECACHKHDTMIPQEKHHVLPQAYGGPTTPENLVTICANAHSDIHYYMDYMLKHEGAKPEDWRTYGDVVRILAGKGFRQVVAKHGVGPARELAIAHPLITVD